MVEYLISTLGDKYQVISKDVIILNALQKRRWNGVDVFFYSPNGHLDYHSAMRDVFGLWTYKHELIFKECGDVCLIKSQKTGRGFAFKGNVYSIKYFLGNKSPELFLNNHKTDWHLKCLSTSLGEREVLIRCPDEFLCKMFTLLYISEDWFNVN